jgi:P27 family predicted phage terminase small subunit
MPVGRKPKPTALKELQGNPGKRPLNKREPKPTGVPTCPSHLDANAKKEWKRISKELLAIGLLTSVDRAALAAYCAAYSRWIAAEESIARFGLVIKAPSGYPVQNPFVSIANTAMDHMRKYATEFGLTPASRTRLQVEPKRTDEDPFKAFMTSIGASDELTPTNDDVCRESTSVLQGCDDGKDTSQQVD